MNAQEQQRGLAVLALKVQNFIDNEAHHFVRLGPGEVVSCDLQIIRTSVVRVLPKVQPKENKGWRKTQQIENRKTPSKDEWEEIFSKIDFPSRLQTIVRKIQESTVGRVKVKDCDAVGPNDCTHFNRLSRSASLPWRLFFVDDETLKRSERFWYNGFIYIFKEPTK